MGSAKAIFGPKGEQDMNDLFGGRRAPPKGVPSSAASTPASGSYSAKDIEVLEGLEPVRRRPGMYIGGTDENALHHLAAEIVDNAMDEAVAGQPDRIEGPVEPGNRLTGGDDGSGVTTHPHPRFPKLLA